jgi:hypothetical protein
MLTSKFFSKPSLPKMARIGLAVALVANLGIFAKVCIADVTNSGTDVGSWCYEDVNHANEPEYTYAVCIEMFCKERPTPALRQECTDKANAQIKKLKAQAVVDVYEPGEPEEEVPVAP